MATCEASDLNSTARRGREEIRSDSYETGALHVQRLANGVPTGAFRFCCGR